MNKFDYIVEFTQIQKQYTMNIIKHSNEEGDELNLVRDVLLQKVLDFTLQTIGLNDCLEFICHKYQLTTAGRTSLMQSQKSED